MSRYNSPTWKDILIGFAVILFIAMGLESCSNNQNQNEIYSKLQNIKAQEIHIEGKSIYFDSTPFSWNTKEMRIYHFTYIENGVKKDGWVRFKAFGNDWIMDYKGKN